MGWTARVADTPESPPIIKGAKYVLYSFIINFTYYNSGGNINSGRNI